MLPESDGMSRLIIAIDGPVGSGKSSVAQRVAALLGCTHLDTGAMYRAIALKAIRSGVALDNQAAVEALATDTRIDIASAGGMLRILLDGADVTEEIRNPEMSQQASVVAVAPGVRRVLVAEQRRIGAAGGVVIEGRDVGTVVFPDAGLKIFLDASVEVRARRRWLEYQQKGREIAFEQLLAEVHERDRRDRERPISPLRRAPDAVYVDSTALDAEEVARLIVMLARERQRELASDAAASPPRS
jgi:cytidylate kinase